MVTSLLRKSITDLSRHRSRTFFAAATLALAVAGIGLFATPSLMNHTMSAEVTADHLPDLTISMRPLVLDQAQLGRLGALANVRAVEPRSFFGGRAYVGARRAFAQVLGIPDFTSQRVNVVHVASGAAPGTGAVMSDVQNAREGLLSVQAGQKVRIIGSDGVVRSLPVSGEGSNLEAGERVASTGVIVLYATPATVASLSATRGYHQLFFTLADTRSAAVDATIAAIRRTLATVPGFTGFSDLPQVRAAGDWPGKSRFDDMSKFLYIITLLALLSALVLISNTMTTLIGEQTSEIGIMKAVGGRRRQIAGVYLNTSLLLGGLGTVAGIALGVVLANVLTRYFASTYFGVGAGFGIDWTIVLASALVGVLGPPLAALPAIRRAVRVPVRQALEASGSAAGGQDAGDRLLRRVHFLPRAAQIGLRNVGRRRRRSASTIMVIAVAVGTLLGALGLVAAAADASRGSWGDHGEDVNIVPVGGRALDAHAAALIRATPGVATVEPHFATNIKVDGRDARIWAVPQATMFHYRLRAGRWYSRAEEQTRAHVAVIEDALARVTATRVGDSITVQTESGPASFQVIGISPQQQENGDALFVPLTTVHAVLTGMPSDASDFWVQTTSHEHAFIDRTTTAIEDTLTAHGYGVDSEIVYVRLANEIASNRTSTNTLAVVGLLVVAISMAGLGNTLTMSVLERTREIGILRSIGARASDIRRIFAAETLTLAAAGWLIGIPLGYLLDWFLVWLVKKVLNLDLTLAFPLWNLPLTLAGTITLALLITLVPIRRATHLRPGAALRYA
ncbi:MAG TPA: FtsX-like permease family protein [Mycobacterium sp.]|nr:FtsX-like permease family protein [Mycobacterium sp.]